MEFVDILTKVFLRCAIQRCAGMHGFGIVVASAGAGAVLKVSTLRRGPESELEAICLESQLRIFPLDIAICD